MQMFFFFFDQHTNANGLFAGSLLVDGGFGSPELVEIRKNWSGHLVIKK